MPQLKNLPNAWAYSYEEMENGHFADANTHEWTETTIDERLNLHDADSVGRNRVFVDGLAEYAAFLVAVPDPNDAKTLQNLLDQGWERVDLPADFRTMRMRGGEMKGSPTDTMQDMVTRQGFAPGYPLSFVFWYDLCQAHGPGLPRRFLSRVGAQPERDFESCVAILEELTGEQGVMQRLQRADVAHAVEVLESLTEIPTSQARR